MKFTSAAFFLVFSIAGPVAYSQEILDEEGLYGTYSYVSVIENVPAELMPPETDSLFFATTGSADTIRLYRRLKNGNYRLFQDLPVAPEEGWGFNEAKAYYPPAFLDGYVNLCSGMPFRATEVCLQYSWNGKHMEYLETIVTDPSWDALEMADSCRQKKNLACMVDAYNAVMYPYSYFSPEEAGMELLSMAHDSANALYRQQKYKEAADIMIVAMDFYGTSSNFSELNSPAQFDEYFPADGFFAPAKVELMMGDYGLFLYKGGYVAESITWNQMVTTARPLLAGPYLQLADALYDTGNSVEAALYYTKYKQLMTGNGKAKNIPKRVNERLK